MYIGLKGVVFMDNQNNEYTYNYTQGNDANADVNTKIHQGAVAGSIKATDKPITTGVKSLDEKGVFNIFSPNLATRIQVITEISAKKSA